MSDKQQFKSIPVNAASFSAEAFIDQKNDNNKSAKFKMLARTGEPISHWFWGRALHDMNGMQLHKNKLTVDYNHDANQIIGYVSNFDTESGDLMASGALTPTREGDKASEVISLMKQEVPFEASINFSDDMVIEEIPEGVQVEVNGRTQQGPLTVFREWGLRNIAVCPMGADKHTSSELMFNEDGSKKEFKVRVINKEAEKELEMSQENAEVTEEVVEETVEATELAEAGNEAVEAVVEEATEEAEVEEQDNTENEEEAAEDDAEESVEGEVLVFEPRTVEAEEVEEPVALSAERKMFASFVEDFGKELAAEYFAQGLDLNGAREQHRQFLIAENKQLKEQAGKIQLSLGEDAPVSVDDASLEPDVDPKVLESKRIAGLDDAQAEYAAKLKIKGIPQS